MTTSLHWIQALALAASVGGCVLAESVGEDPELMNDSGGAESTGGAGSATSQGPVTASSASTAGATSTTSGGNPTATSTSTTGGFPGPDACGIEPVPDGLPGYMYSFSCEGGCSFEYVVPLPLDDYDAISECLCGSSGCGIPNGEVGEGGFPGGGTGSYDGICDVDIMPNDGSGYYEASCLCEVCDVTFTDIHPDSAESLFENDDSCNCLCLEAGCGYSTGGGGGEVGGAESGESDTGGTTSTGG